MLFNVRKSQNRIQFSLDIIFFTSLVTQILTTSSRTCVSYQYLHSMGRGGLCGS